MLKVCASAGYRGYVDAHEQFMGTLKEKIGMRTLIINLLATALLLFGASSASAFAVNMVLNPGSADTSTVLAPSDVVILDIYLDADPGLGLIQLAVLYDDDGVVNYEQGLSTMPTYILYTGGKGATYLVPLASPPPLWGGNQQPGKKQVNVAFNENALGYATASGNNIWIATLVFHVAAIGDGQSTIELTLLGNGSTIITANGQNISDQVPVGGTFVVNTTSVPEPTTALLIGFGLVGLTLAGRRQS
jgi:hypothetical protein